jgi:hypothetical protein
MLRAVVEFAGDIRWMELGVESSPFTEIDRQLLRDMHYKARSSGVLDALASLPTTPIEGDGAGEDERTFLALSLFNAVHRDAPGFEEVVSVSDLSDEQMARCLRGVDAVLAVTFSPRPPVDGEGLVEQFESAVRINVSFEPGVGRGRDLSDRRVADLRARLLAALRQPTLPEGEAKRLIDRLRAPLFWWCGSSPDDERVDTAPVEAADLLAALSQPPGMRKALEEAEKIIAWLRHFNRDGSSPAAGQYADMIERGEHRAALAANPEKGDG